ncbi:MULTISPECIES: carbohydrate ABC transporter permease [unclassified Micromonospora]|uniref:carbohydrate ABC transporter permease n=1 Tax=unclassified Micromonospora TaxID=2617518 RepID=UPI002FF21D42
MTTPVQTPAPAPTPAHRRPATSAPEARGHLWVYAVLAGGLVLLVGPFLWMLLGSFKPDAELRQVPPTWLPASPTTDNYRQLFTQLDFPQFFFNSTVVALAITVGNLVFCSMLGYALAKLQFPGKRVVFALVLGMLMVPGMVTFVPLFMLVSQLGMVNSYPGLILPWLAQPFGVFLMRQFILGLPDDLIHAARVDGAGEFRIFTRVILPLCGPALATLGILQFLATWNNFLWPLVVAQSEEKYTLPVALALYAIGENSTRYGLLMAGSVATILPILLIFVLLQRYFVQGIAMTGLK